MPIKAKILLVDDETEFAERVARLLERRGFLARTAYDGESAILALQEEDYDVMVLDLKMPGLDGITTLKKTLELGLLTQVLILTGHGSVDTALEAMKLGAYDYLAKPCQIEELVIKIDSAWEAKAAAEKRELEKKVKQASNSHWPTIPFLQKRKEKRNGE